MVRRWSIDRRTTVGMVIGLLLLAALGRLSYQATEAFREDSEVVSQIHVAIETAVRLRTLVAQPESEVRTFVITGDSSYLELQPRVRDSAQHTIAVLDSLLQYFPVQEDLFNTLEPLLAERFDLLDSTVAIRRHEGQQAAIRVIMSERRKIVSAQINSILDRIEEIERRLLADRDADTNRRAQDTVRTLVLGTTISAILFLAIFVLLNKEIRARKMAEGEARAGEAHLRDFLDLVPAGIFILTADGRPYFANRAAIHILGRGIDPTASAEILTERYAAVRAGTDETYPSAELPIVRALAGEQSTVDNLEVIRDGQRIPLLVSGAPVYGESGRLEYALAAFLDISDQRRIQRVIEENERRFREIVEGASDIIYRTDENGRFTFVNLVGLRSFGYTEAEIRHSRYVDVIRPDARDRVQRFYLRQAAAREPTTYLEIPVITKSGQEILLGQKVTLLMDESLIVGFQAVARDITEERRAQDTLARRERQLDTVVSTVDEGITYSDEHGFFEIFNRKMEVLTGYSKEEANQTPDFSALLYPDPGEHQAGLDRLQEVLDNGSIREVETSIRTKTGERRILLVSTTLIHQQNRKMFLSIYRDISEWKRQEELLRQAMEAATTAARARAEFLAVMSHEIRTPMNGVIGMTDVLMHTDLTTEQAEYVETIRTSGETLLTIINDILDFSKIESGRLSLEHRPFDIVSAVEDVYDLLSFKAREKNLDLLYVLEPAVPRTIEGDVTRVRQILLNLVGNAVKFTPSGQVLTRITRTEGNDESFHVRIAVQDTGIGIPREAQGRLFQAFSQIDSSTTRRFGGTGLGLVISKRLVELMDGTLSVESDLGKGSTFAFTFLTRIPAEVASAPTLYLRSRLDALRTKHILLVDDNTTNLEILRAQTSQWGMVPTLASRPEEALERIRGGEQFDVAVLDMNMPAMDGLTLAREIRIHRKKEELPLLLLSSRGRSGPVSPDQDDLFFTVIAKPIRELQLLEHVTAAVAGRPVSERATRRRATDEPLLASRLPLRILVAEDNDVNRKLIARLLQKLGYAARIVTDGREAVDEALIAPYDIVLMDVNMPVLDGLEATREIQRQLPPERQPAILALTAGVLQEDQDRCAEAGMVDFLSKPLHMNELRAALERWGLARTVRREMPVDSSPPDEPDIVARIRQLVEDTDRAFIRDLLRDFIPHAREMALEIERNSEEQRWPAVRQTAHALKGGALNVGATVLGNLCGQIQHAVEENRQDLLPELLLQFREQWSRSIQAMEMTLTSILVDSPA